MSPPNPYVVNMLRGLIYYHLDNNNLRNALFMAGRLQAYDSRSADTAHLLGLCHIRLGEHKGAYECTKAQALKGSHVGCAYVFAEACLYLSDGREKEGIEALERIRGLWLGRNNWSSSSKPRAALCLSLFASRR
jgi:anaphase-promoting complex subunit 3